jgi:acyl-CoA synthetase (AMP-forming)/AMP-acid ligase II
MSLAWLYGLCTTSMSFLAAGATVDLLDHFNPVRVLESIEAHRGSVFVGVATMYIKLLDVLTSRDFDVSSMRVWSVGGEPVPDALHSGFERRVGRRILEAYGSSEVRPLAITNPAKDPDPPAGAAGSLVLGVELRLVDADGNDVPRGTPGEAWARGPGMMTEYFREPEITAQRRTADGWFKMGDILRQDEAGWVYVVGRTGDMIIRGGTNVSPIEIESALLEHEDVDEAIVVGVPDATYGEAIVAVVVGRSGREIDPEILRAHAAGSVAAYKVPQAFWVTDDLPRNPNGKLDRSAVKRRAADEVAGGGELSDRVAGPFV